MAVISAIWRTLVATPTRRVLLVILALGWVAIFYRLIFGLGAATNLSDSFPWGIWIALDVLAGVALAAGGFTLALVVYILNLERYRSLLRPAILTALVGYILSAAAILFDLGQPQRIWHPLIYGNIRSPLLEVALCVMAYLAVLALEFSPAVLERLQWGKLLTFIKAITIPLVVAGVVLSTLHQSSLGALFLIAPGRLHPLYYTPLLPWLFYISAVAVGLGVVALESYVSCRTMGLGCDARALASLGKATWWLLLLYGVLRFGDLAVGGRLGLMFEGSLASNAFLLETLVGLLLPLLLLAMPSVRNRVTSLFWAQALVVAGVMLNRLDTALIAMAEALGGTYFPSLIEVAVTLGMIATGTLTYILAVQFLPVHEVSAAAPGD